MLFPWEQWLVAALLATAIAAAAMKVRALSSSGAAAAILLGTVVVGTGGWWVGIVLVAFFASSSLLSQPRSSTSIDQARGSRRDWVQVLANGWGMLAGTMLYAVTGWLPWLLFGVGAIAAATADTWSSEIGRTSASPPRLVTTWARVSRGTSGAVSTRGLAASLGGGIFIAAILALAVRRDSLFAEFDLIKVLPAIVMAGFLGGLVDSYLGATVQEQRFCDQCQLQTESNPHGCGSPTQRIRGIAGLNNDVVNVGCVLTGALIGLFSGIL